jgi:hypothetical protein
MMGRTSDLTPALQASICKDIEAGNTIATACAINGISQATYYQWLEKGKAGQSPAYVDFLESATQARHRAKANAIAAVRAGVLGGPGNKQDWKAEAWFLEKSFPDEFGPQQAVTVKVEKALDETLDKLERKLPPDVYAQVLEAISGEQGGGASGEDPSLE